jgi:hypothetical protein
METEKVIEFLDWLVALDIQHYATEESDNYKPSGASHFYLKRSLERFTSQEMIDIWNDASDKELSERWKWAIARSIRK